MSLKATTVGLHPARQEAKARAVFLECRGMFDIIERETFIESLPRVEWKGQTLYTLRCHGTSGKGPHDCNVPPSLIWSLIEPRAYRCPYHATDYPVIGEQR